MLRTEAGLKLCGFVQQIIDLHRQARNEITGHEPPVTGELLIAASSIPGEHLLPTLVSSFGQKYPRIRVRAAVSDSMAVLAQVERGEVSVGLVGRKADNPNMKYRFLASDRTRRQPHSICGHRRALFPTGAALTIRWRFRCQ